jgi:hypothetical protein
MATLEPRTITWVRYAGAATIIGDHGSLLKYLPLEAMVADGSAPTQKDLDQHPLPDTYLSTSCEVWDCKILGPALRAGDQTEIDLRTGASDGDPPRVASTFTVRFHPTPQDRVQVLQLIDASLGPHDAAAPAPGATATTSYRRGDLRYDVDATKRDVIEVKLSGVEHAAPPKAPPNRRRRSRASSRCRRSRASSATCCRPRSCA